VSIALVTDSTADIEPNRAEALGITIVPLFVIFGERSYRDYIDLSRAEFYHKLATDPALPITSQPTAQMFEEAFRPHIEAGREILCITIASHLSGTINAARAAAAQFAGKRIEIYDSESAAGGLGMMVLRARELIDLDMPWSKLLAELDAERSTQRLYAAIPDLSHLVRTGRIGKAQAALGTLMKIVPVLCLKDGEVAAHAQVRTFGRAREVMLSLALGAVADASRTRLLVMHTNAPELAEAARAALNERLAATPPRALDVLEAGPAIAVHAGAGAVGVFVACDEPVSTGV
jgi:DegV family protein with EDD domain